MFWGNKIKKVKRSGGVVKGFVQVPFPPLRCSVGFTKAPSPRQDLVCLNSS